MKKNLLRLSIALAAAIGNQSIYATTNIQISHEGKELILDVHVPDEDRIEFLQPGEMLLIFDVDVSHQDLEIWFGIFSRNISIPGNASMVKIWTDDYGVTDIQYF